MIISDRWRRFPELRLAIPLFVIALLIRAALIFHPGHVHDFQIFHSWAEKGSQYGITEIYNQDLPGHMSDYPPVMLYLYTGVGHIIDATQGDHDRSKLSTALVKLPGIAGDFALAAAIIVFASLTIGRRRGLSAATLYLLLPASWLDSAVWGQVDSVYTLMILMAFGALALKRGWLAGIAAGLAICTKFQAVAFLPLLAAVAWVLDWRLLARGVAATLATAGLIVLPFALAGNLDQVIEGYSRAVGAYSVLSANAFNIWRIGFGDAASEIQDTNRVGGVSYREWGFVMFGLAMAIVIAFTVKMLRSARDDEVLRMRIILAAAAVVSLTFFMFPTQIHERYLFPFLGLGAFFATRGKVELATYFVISSGIALNITYRVSIDAAEKLYLTIPAAERIIATGLFGAGLLASVLIFSRIPRFPPEKGYG